MNLGKKIKKLRKAAGKYRHDQRPGKRRFGLYRYLRDVYAVYLDLRSRRISRKATRKIAKTLKLPIQKKSHPIRILIEASSGPEDVRQKSRWTQALRYAFGWRQPAENLEWFFKNCGGISGAAGKFAIIRRGRWPSNIVKKNGSGDLGQSRGSIEANRQIGSSDLSSSNL